MISSEYSQNLHVLHIYSSHFSFFSDFFSLSFLVLPSLHFSLSIPSLSLSTLFIYFPCRRVQGAGKSLMSDAYREFHGSAVKLHSGISFSRGHVHDMACRKPFCSVILSGTISPMRFDDRGPSNARTERFRFPRVSGSSVCFAPIPRLLFRSTRRIYRARCRRASA